jgi:hypothetical protein
MRLSGRCQGLRSNPQGSALTGEAREDASLSANSLAGGLGFPACRQAGLFPLPLGFGNVRSMLPPLAPWGADGAGKVQRPFEHFVCPTGDRNKYLP